MSPVDTEPSRQSNNVARALRLIARAENLVRLSDTASVDALLERAMALAPHVPKVRAGILSVRVPLARLRGHYDQALGHAKRAFAACDEIGDVTGHIAVRIEIARVLLAAGNTSEALKEGLAALSRVEAISDEAARRKTTVAGWRLLVYVHLALEHFDQAIHFCERAIAGARVDANVVMEGALYDCMACAYGTMAYHSTAAGRHSEAGELLERSVDLSRRAIVLARQGGHRPNEATALANVAEGLVQGGRPDEALALMETWRVEPVRDVGTIACHHFDTHGSICMGLGRHAEAIVLFKRALDSATQSNLAIAACEHLAEACERVGDIEAALMYYKRFHALFKRAASEAAQRSASTAAVYLETREAMASADGHRQIAEALQQSNEQLTRHAEDLIALSRHDPLTGLPNRRVMQQVMGDHQDGLGIVMIDVDRFKLINDGWSHMVGDSVLRQVALLIRSCCREIDTPIRYGGDEFAILLQQADERHALLVAKRVHALIDEFDWGALAPALSVSVSVGYAASQGRTAVEATLAIADQRLYAAKHGGRNRVGGHTTLQ